VTAGISEQIGSYGAHRPPLQKLNNLDLAAKTDIFSHASMVIF
jgi:hypothetical protein